ncbi:MAG: tetratricopeptide repeat protein [candidate division Zixibacteria bacterium]
MTDLIKLADDIPIIGLLPKIAKVINKADKQTSDWFAKKGNTLLQDLPSMEAKDIEKLIPVLFAEDLNTYTEDYGYKTVVFIDTYEQLWGKDRTEGNRFTKDEWIRGIVEKTPGVLWTISGREELEWPKRDKTWKDRIESCRVEDLEEGYAHEYLIGCGIENENIRKVIFEGSKGVPFYLDISVDTFEKIKEKGKEPTVDDLGKTHRDILDRFIRNLNNDEIETLKVLSTARFWNKDIFIAMVKEFGTGYPLTKINDFHRFSFIKERAGENTWTMHELMRESLFEHTLAKELLNKSNTFLFNHYNAQLEDIEPKNITETHKTAFGEAYYHAKQCFDIEELDIWFSSMTNIFKDAAEWIFLIPLLSNHLSFQERKLGKDHQNVATTLNNLALLYKFIGRFKEAESMYERSIKLYKNRLDPYHSDLATALNNLAGVFRSLGKFEKAKSICDEALEIFNKTLGQDHPDVAKTLNNKAALYVSLGRNKEAEPLYKRSFEILEKALGPDHPIVAVTLNNLAGLYEILKRFNEAELLYKRSLEIREKALGPDHPDVGTTLNNLAELYKFLGRNKEAELLYKRSLMINEKALGPDHSDVATTLNNLAGFYESLGRYQKAEHLYKRSLHIKEKSVGLDHPDVATTLNNLANLNYSLGKYSEAESLFMRALKIWENSFGLVHPNIATVLENMAALYEKMGKEDKARECSVRAKEIREELGR